MTVWIHRMLKLARSAVDMVLNIIEQQVSILQSNVQEQFQGMVNEVVGGVWVGDGADRFVEELTGMVLPNTDLIIGSCTVTTGSINNAVAIIEAADAQANGIVCDLDGMFQGIFPG
ncbi:MAG: hypothetical protein ACPG8W_23770 [Candidatus Promineifilaceae bacterium]